MRAVVYRATREVRVEEVPEPRILAEDDLIIRVTSTAICGSDLHIYRGEVLGMKPGDILGHEPMGIVEEVGPAVTRVRKGDRVVVPFVIGCGECYFCRRGLWSACEKTNPGPGGALNKKELHPPAALYGYSHLYGGVPGGQAEYLRVPKANQNPLVVPDFLTDEQVLFLSDILPTGYQAALNAQIEPGSIAAIYGAGPVGLMTAMCARHLGAERIFMVDNVKDRLSFAAETFGVIPIDFDERDPAAYIIESTDGRGADAVIDAVGMDARGSKLESMMVKMKLEGSSGAALRQCIAAARRGGIVSIPGVYVGPVQFFMLGDAFDKGLTFRMGQTHVQRFLPELLRLLEEGRLHPEVIISHRLRLEEAPEAYERFEKPCPGFRKVVLSP